MVDRIRKCFCNILCRKKDNISESIKPNQWQKDEMAVKSGTCMFPVKYLGCVEVFDSRGMQTCEDALQKLRVCFVKFVAIFLNLNLCFSTIEL